MTNQGGIEAFPDFAKKITTEYDMCIRRGLQDCKSIPISARNTAGMEALVTIACTTALSKQDGMHTFADDIGKGVVALLDRSYTYSGNSTYYSSKWCNFKS